MGDNIALNQKLLKWAGLEWKWNHNPDCHCGAVDDDDSERSWYTPDGELATRFYHETIDFTDPVLGIAYCFKLLVPKLSFWEIIRDERAGGFTQVFVWGFNEKNEVEGVGVYKGIEAPALAFCLAVEQLADEKKSHK